MLLSCVNFVCLIFSALLNCKPNGVLLFCLMLRSLRSGPENWTQGQNIALSELKIIVTSFECLSRWKQRYGYLAHWLSVPLGQRLLSVGVSDVNESKEY